MVRNFWIEANVDGRETPVSGGPRSKDGGFELSVKIRNCGEIGSTVYFIDGFVNDKGKLETRVFRKDSSGIHLLDKTITER